MSEILKLRVINLGEKQVVQRLSGERKPFFFPYLAGEDVQLDDYTIDEMKKTFTLRINTLNAEAQAECDRLNGSPPVPRIERIDDLVMRLHVRDDYETKISCQQLKALEQIIGHEIPIYEPKPKYTGEWVRVASYIDIWFDMWEYTVTEQ